MKRNLTALLMTLMLLYIAILPASAAQPVKFDSGFLAIAKESAQTLYDLGLFYGTGTLSDGSPNFDLEKKATRGEAIAMLVRLLGGENEARSRHYSHPFQDASWASDYIGYAYEKGISYGISETEFGVQNEVDLATFLTLVLRALDYDVEDWRNPYALADQVGLLYVEGDCYRADISIICLSALDCEVNGADALLFDLLYDRGVFDNIIHGTSNPNPSPTPVPEPTPIPQPTPEPEPQPSPTPVQNFGPVTQEISTLTVISKEDLVQRFTDVMNGRTSKATIYVPKGMEEAYAVSLNNEISRYSDLRQSTIYYYSYSGCITVELLYDDAASAMAYLEGKSSTINANAREALEKAQQIHAQLVTNGMSEYEQVKAFHDYLVNHNTYEETGERSHSAVGALVDGKSVCEGYMEAFDLLCYLSNIDCLQISGIATSRGSSEAHGWNKVKIDGSWYNIDVTWDDPVSTRPVLRYDYFLISDEKLSQNHQWTAYPHWPPAPANYPR